MVRKQTEYDKQYRIKNKERLSRLNALHARELKYATLKQYGGIPPVCNCCGEHRVEFLTIDHPERDGAAHRKALGIKSGQKFYRWLRNNGFPKGFRVLCFNCNASQGIFGYCPHSSVV